jgi:tetratricopeptide (TPR) repeat protein
MNEQAKEYQNRGIALMGEGNYPEAAKLFDKALEVEESAELYMDLGNAYASSSRYQEAINAFTQALSFEPNNGEIFFAIGSVYLLQERLKKCIESYNKAEALGFDNPRLYINLAAIYNALGDRQMELRNYTKAIDKDSLRGDLYIKKAILLLDLGKLDAALETISELRGVHPDSFEAYDLAARVYMLKGLPAKAIEILDEGISKYFNDVNLKLSKIGILVSLGKLEDAETLLEETKKNTNANIYNRAILLQETSIASAKQDYTKLKKILAEVIALENEGECDEQSRYMMMMINSLSEEYDLALEQAEKLDSLQSKSIYSISGMYYMGEFLEKVGRFEEAENQFRKSVRKLRMLSVNERTNYEVYIFRAMAHEHLKEYDKALEMAEFVTNLQPERADGYILLANIYKDMGDEGKSMEQFNIAKEKNPELKER